MGKSFRCSATTRHSRSVAITAPGLSPHLLRVPNQDRPCWGTIGSSELNRLARGVVVPLVVELPVGLSRGHEAAVRFSVGPAELFPILLDGVQAYVHVLRRLQAFGTLPITISNCVRKSTSLHI